MKSQVATLGPGSAQPSAGAPAASVAGEPVGVHATTRSWLALEFPGLSLAALGVASADAPRAVSAHHGRRAHVLAANEAARAVGVAPGMDVTAATAVCPALRVHGHDPQAEAAALQGLACWALGYTSQVSLQPPRGVVMEIGASLRLFGGLGPLLRALEEDLRAMGHEVRRGIAPTPTAAWLFARAAASTPVHGVDRLADSVARIPVACLDLPPAVKGDLQALGSRTLGDCMRLPRDGLGRRFGGELLALLDRALGRSPDPRACFVPPPCFERRMDLAVESVDRGLLLEAARRLIHELSGFLRARASGACAVELELAHRGVPATRVVLELVSPCSDAQRLLALVGERVEHLPLHHEVCYLGLRVHRLQELHPHTGDLCAPRGRGPEGVLQAHECGHRAQRLVERLGARLGADAVRVLESVADHRPERSSAEIPWHLAAGRRGEPPRPSPGAPVWLLPRPRPLQGGRNPASVDGPLHVEHGPWRIESGWWDGEDVARDYYVARSTRGTRYWLFRECREPRHWYLHGIFA